MKKVLPLLLTIVITAFSNLGVKAQNGNDNPGSSPENGPIYTEPAGEKTYYYRDAYGFYFGWDDRTLGSRSGGISIIDGEDGYTYIHNPFSGWPTGSYLKGKKENNQIKVELPQLIYVERDIENAGKYIYFYATILENTTGFTGDYYYEESEIQELVYDITDSGDIVMNLNSEQQPGGYPEYIFGMISNDDLFYVGDASQTLKPANVSMVEPPVNTETENWDLIIYGDPHQIKLAFDGEEVYLYNFDNIYARNTWIKGKMEGDVLSFPTGQFLCERDGYFYWFVAAEQTGNTYETLNEFSFTFDKERMIMTSSENECMVANPVKETVSYNYPEFMSYNSPVLKYVTEIPSSYVPRNPTLMAYVDYGTSVGYQLCEFAIYALSVDFDELDTDNLYFHLYFNGEPEELLHNKGTFDFPFSYFDELPDYLTIQSFGGYVDLFLYIEGLESIGIELMYEAPNGETYYSDIVTYDILNGTVSNEPTTSISKIYDHSEVIKTELYDYNGKRISNDYKGLVIERQYMEDGTVRSRKIIRR